MPNWPFSPVRSDILVIRSTHTWETKVATQGGNWAGYLYNFFNVILANSSQQQTSLNSFFIAASFSCQQRESKNKLPSSPRITGSRGTPSIFAFYTKKSICAKFGAFFQSVNVFSPSQHSNEGCSLREPQCLTAVQISCFTGIHGISLLPPSDMGNLL